MADRNKNLWAPWRMEYIRSLGEELSEEGCFLCRYWSDPARDGENHVIWRTPTGFVVMNRFPYTNGHLLVCLGEHRGELHDLGDEEMTGMTRMIRDAVSVLREALAPEGFNIGYNLGRCAGAGLPGHLHAHVVPRWSGDTNFMAVIGDTRVIPDALDAAYRELVDKAAALGLR
ncbi:MAG: HIT domain-containing protein [Planctomycetota bacterium]|nr:MAG: HIT domain-containing protein [Planctomycetota bacterium]